MRLTVGPARFRILGIFEKKKPNGGKRDVGWR